MLKWCRLQVVEWRDTYHDVVVSEREREGDDCPPPVKKFVPSANQLSSFAACRYSLPSHISTATIYMA